MARREDDPTGADRGEEYPGSGSIGNRNLYDQVAQYYRDFLGRDGSPDEINGWLQSGQTIDQILNGIKDSDEAKARSAAPPTAPVAPQPGDRTGGPPPAPPPAPSGPEGAGGLGTGGSVGGLPPGFFTQLFPGHYTPPPEPTGPPSWWQPAPTFTPPTYKAPPAFAPPTLGDALQDPGYQFAAKEGQNALERSAAARGVLGTSGTLKDLISWGGNYAQQRYQDVFGRALQGYNTNYQTQYADPYSHAYTAALDVYSPQLQSWGQQMQATQRGSEFDKGQAWQKFLADWDIWRGQRNDIWNRFATATGT